MHRKSITSSQDGLSSIVSVSCSGSMRRPYMTFVLCTLPDAVPTLGLRFQAVEAAAG